ncbi:MAG: alkaline phosphatase family protein, partial [Ignavibacteriae bacterium]|nr:alkaline phosphatase family protein [Ignavibacteriota bacterium]
DDETVMMLGSTGMGRSPRNLKLTTVGDMLRLRTGNQSKVVGISSKDRSAILMAGKTGTAYWIEDSVVVTSTYYMKSLPPYISAFNRSGIFEQYFGQTWTEVNPLAAAKLCDTDDAWYESGGPGLGRTFPHRIIGNDFTRITPSYYGALDGSPFSAEILLALGRSIFAAESLGTRGVTDMFCIGISTPDIIGHSFGPNSHEVFDDVLRTDSLLASFFSFLDTHVGLDNCIIALSSDHGIAPIPEYIKKTSPATDAGRITADEVSTIANRVLSNRFRARSSIPRWVEKVIDCDIYLNAGFIDSLHVPIDSAMHVLRDSLRTIHPFAAAYSRDQVARARMLDTLGKKVALSYYALRSGDVMFILKPFYVTGSEGTNHGQPYDYDTHVPLIMTGRGIKPGVYANNVSPIDIAPTLSYILKIAFPPNREGNVLMEALK